MRGEHMKMIMAATSSRKDFHAEAHKHLAARPDKTTTVQAYALNSLPSGSDDDSQLGMSQ